MINDDCFTGHFSWLLWVVLLFIFIFFYFVTFKEFKAEGTKHHCTSPIPTKKKKKKMVCQKKPSCLLVPASCHSLSDVKLTIFSITGNHFKITISWYSLSIWQLGVFLCIGLLLIILSSFKLKLCTCPVITPIYYCKASNMSEW